MRFRQIDNIYLKQSCITCVFLAVFVLSGCIDFAEVTKFAALSQAANSSFPALVADIEDSCKRQATYFTRLSNKRQSAGKL